MKKLSRKFTSSERGFDATRRRPATPVERRRPHLGVRRLAAALPGARLASRALPHHFRACATAGALLVNRAAARFILRSRCAGSKGRAPACQDVSTLAGFKTSSQTAFISSRRTQFEIHNPHTEIPEGCSPAPRTATP